MDYMKYVEMAIPILKEIIGLLRMIGLPLIPVLLLAIIAYFIKIDKFIKLRDEITEAKKRAQKFKDLRKLREKTALYERKIDRAFKDEKITDLDRQYLETLLAQMKYLNITYR